MLKEERSAGAPDIPTAIEAGVPGAIAYTYNIILAPAGTPDSIIKILSDTMNKVMSDRELLASLVKIGVDPVSKSSPDEAVAMIKAELAKWKPLIESLGLRR